MSDTPQINENKHQTLLYYKFIAISNPDAVVAMHKIMCDELELKGRVLISKEGINGTVEGIKDNIDKYISIMDKSDLFGGIKYKRSYTNGLTFPKMKITARDEIVTTGLDYNEKLGPLTGVTGKYISAEELHDLIHPSSQNQKEEFYIIDMRNDYEFKIGHFENSIMPKAFQNFRDIPNILSEIEHLKDKKVITVCTGGVRCEKASGFLIYHGFTNVYQLQDGIVTYMEKYPNEDFVGKLYVFDKRLAIGFNLDDVAHKIIGRCDLCGVECEKIVDYYYDPSRVYAPVLPVADKTKLGKRSHGIVCDKCLLLPTVVLD